MSGRVRENVQRFGLIGSSVVQQRRAQVLGAPAVPLQVCPIGYTEVLMHLLGNLVRRPGGPGEILHLVDSQHSPAGRVHKTWVPQITDLLVHENVG